MIRLQGDTPYQMVNHATGKLATKLQSLIYDHEDSPLVLELTKEFIAWWYLPFEHPEKDAIGRDIWDRADEIRIMLDCDTDDVYSDVTDSDVSDSDIPDQPINIQPIPITKLEQVGSTVGTVIGKLSAATANTTISAANATSKWVKTIAVPAVIVGSEELWKGLKATIKATKEAYIQSRDKSEADDDIPY